MKNFNEILSWLFSRASQKSGLESAAPPIVEALEYKPDDFTAGENCYAYALNRKGQDREFNPGRIALEDGKEYVHFDSLYQFEIDKLTNRDFNAYVKNVTMHFQSEAERDGLIPVKEQKDFTRGDGYLVALVMKHHSINEQTSKRERDIDYHWLRQNSDGTWSHKIPSKLPTNKDSVGHDIIDPRTANLGDYKHFVGFFVVPPIQRQQVAAILKSSPAYPLCGAS